MFLCIVFALASANNDTQKEEEHRSAEGRMPTA
jgi:hypothetical protein